MNKDIQKDIIYVCVYYSISFSKDLYGYIIINGKTIHLDNTANEKGIWLYQTRHNENLSLYEVLYETII
jgi:hypothetical protein